MKSKTKFFSWKNVGRGFKSWITNILAGILIALFVIVVSPLLIAASVLFMVIAGIIFFFLFLFYLMLKGFLLKKFWGWN